MGVSAVPGEPRAPAGADRIVFVMGPMLTFILGLIAWAVIPFGRGMVLADINVGVLYLFAISALGVYGAIMAGWASNAKHAFPSALRSAARMVPYKVSMGFVIVTVLLWVGSLNLTDIVMAQQDFWFCLPLLPMFVIFSVSILADTDRSPFEPPEGESEPVAGVFVEYANMVLMSGITAVLFLGGWLPLIDIAPFNLIPGPIWFAAKTALVLFFFLWVRATLPRHRHDQLMRLGWKVFPPMSLFAVIFYAGLLLYTGWLPA